MLPLSPAALEFGGSNDYSGVSTSRTLMLKELTALLARVPNGAAKGDYRAAVVSDNALMKPSASTRAKTYAYLRDRFALDPEIPLFNVLRFLWERDEPGQPLLALLVAAFRDPVLRSSFPAMISLDIDGHLSSDEFARIVGAAFPGKLSEKSLDAVGERLTSTYRQSGHLRGKRDCVRQRVTPTPGSATMALLLASLEGAGGMALLDTEWVRILDAPGELLLAEARAAASRGWLEMRQAGDVLEITFRQLLAATTGAS